MAAVMAGILVFAAGLAGSAQLARAERSDTGFPPAPRVPSSYSAGPTSTLKQTPKPIQSRVPAPVLPTAKPLPVSTAVPAPIPSGEAALERMIGQMIMIGFEGRSPREAGVRSLLAAIGRGEVGGVMLLGHNISSSEQVLGLNMALSAAAETPAAPKASPLLIAIDQEGGHVQRLGPRQGVKRYPSAALLARRGDAAAARGVYNELARDLTGHGFNVNFGPVVDIDIGPDNPVIGRLRRSYGRDPKQISGFASAFIAAHRAAGILTAAKHFPGHGSSSQDSHLSFVDVSRSWRAAELEPYAALSSDKGADMVMPDMIMIGHLYHPRFSPDSKLPATLSRHAITVELRQKLGYEGVVISDDLQMAAIRERFGLREALIRAINAGTDIVLLATAPRDWRTGRPKAFDILREAVQRGDISRARIVEANARIAAMKRRLRARLAARE